MMTSEEILKLLAKTRTNLRFLATLNRNASLKPGTGPRGERHAGAATAYRRAASLVAELMEKAAGG